MSQDRFAPRTDADVDRLIAEHPLAWVVSGLGAEIRATPLPIRPRFDTDGRLTHLVGHFARSNPQVEGLRHDPRALILFLGPQGYISPSWMGDRTQAPTWNYASAQFLVEVELMSDPDELQALLQDLIDTVEARRPDAWRLEEMGERFARLSRMIVGFQAHILDTRAKFKLGQDERDDVFADILAGLEATGGVNLREWMREFEVRKA